MKRHYRCNLTIAIGAIILSCLIWTSQTMAQSQYEVEALMNDCLASEFGGDTGTIELVVKSVRSVAFSGDKYEITMRVDNTVGGSRDTVKGYAACRLYTYERNTNPHMQYYQGTVNNFADSFNMLDLNITFQQKDQNWTILVGNYDGSYDRNLTFEFMANHRKRGLFGMTDNVECDRIYLRFRKTDQTMARIPAGTIEVGRREPDPPPPPAPPANPQPRDWEIPLYCADVDEFYIDHYEVTYAQYRQFVEAGGYHEQSYWHPDGWEWRVNNNVTQPLNWDTRGYDYNIQYHPVTGVCWFEADAFARWRGKRLPTEAEWEKAARSGHNWIYPWGNSDLSMDADNSVNRTQDCQDMVHLQYCIGNIDVPGTAPVGNYPIYPNYFLADMVGNVWEWVGDWYKPDYYQDQINDYNAECVPNPQGPCPNDDPMCMREKELYAKVVRGGGFTTAAEGAVNLGWREAMNPTARSRDLGFRCVSDTPVPPIPY